MSRKEKTSERKGNEWCSPEVRQRAVREVVERGARVKDVAKLFGVSEAAVTKWVAKFRRGGVEVSRLALSDRVWVGQTDRRLGHVGVTLAGVVAVDTLVRPN